MVNAEKWKQKGNKLFQAGRFDEALECYSRAIIKNPNEAIYFTNRAACQLRLNKWDLAAYDCRKALELDEQDLRANYHLGKILIHFEEYNEAVEVLTLVHDLIYNQKLSYGDDVAELLRKARSEKFRIQEERRIAQEIELQSYLNSLIDEDTDRKVQKIDEEIKNGREEELDEAVQQQIKSIRNQGSTSKDQLNRLFAQVDDRRKKREIPDYFCGKIGFELLKKPVITPSGNHLRACRYRRTS